MSEAGVLRDAAGHAKALPGDGDELDVLQIRHLIAVARIVLGIALDTGNDMTAAEGSSERDRQSYARKLVTA